MAVAQRDYTERMPEATAGMIATQVDWDAITLVSEDTDAIGFGLAVCNGVADGACLLGGALNVFKGASMKDITLVVGASRVNADAYILHDNVGILRRGEIWVQVSAPVTKASPVHYDATTGVFGPSGGSGPVRGARWEKASITVGEVQLGLLYLSGDGQAT